MRWNNYYLINLNSWDENTRRIAGEWQEHYNLAPDRVFAPQGQLWPPAHAQGSDKLYSPLMYQRTLAPLDRGCKLVIVSHGYTMLTVPSATGKLAGELYQWALREVGLIAFQGDYDNPERYLLDMAMALNDRRIGFGWLTAYQNRAGTWGNFGTSSSIWPKPVAWLRGNIKTPETDKWLFLSKPKRTKSWFG